MIQTSKTHHGHNHRLATDSTIIVYDTDGHRWIAFDWCRLSQTKVDAVVFDELHQKQPSWDAAWNSIMLLVKDADALQYDCNDAP